MNQIHTKKCYINFNSYVFENNVKLSQHVIECAVIFNLLVIGEVYERMKIIYKLLTINLINWLIGGSTHDLVKRTDSITQAWK